MYARYFTFKANPGSRSEVEALADQAFGSMKSLKGFVSAHFIVSEDENEYGSFSLWESSQDAESAGDSLRSKMKEVLEKLAVEPPTQRVFEVYKPKS
jgi:heme-degrading monooxygenase HmoA